MVFKALAKWCDMRERPAKTNSDAKDISARSRELMSSRIKHIAGQKTSPGDSKTRLYSIWAGMKNRCINPGCGAFKRYGAKGISVCDEWRNCFAAFKEWAMQNGYQNDLEIDRKNGRGNYEPSNCRWATRAQQTRNTWRRLLKGKPKTSKFRGVSRAYHSRRWVASMNKRYLGAFATELEAAKAYDAAAHVLHGEFARLNFPERYKDAAMAGGQSGPR